MMNLNAAVEALDSVRFLNCRMADTAGLEPVTSHCADIVVDAAGALPLELCVL